MRFYLMLVLGVVVNVVWAQKPVLKVVDKKNGEPLPYVNLCFESFNTANKQYTTTNLKGEAFNLCKDSCMVVVSYMGYKTIYDTLVKGEEATFRLEEDAFNLDQVVVTATRSRKALKDVPVITQVITSKDIADRGMTNVQDVLSQDIPGIELQRGGFGTDMKMQGLEAKNILILVDGERLAGETGYNVDYSRLNTSDIERIEVVKGAASALYGSQAMGGVINIITKKPRKKWEASVGTIWTQRNELNFPDADPADDDYRYEKNLDRQNLNINASVGFKLKHLTGRTDVVTKSFDAYKLYDQEPIIKKFINIDTVVVADMNPFPTGINGYSDYQISQKLEMPITDDFHLSMKGGYYHHDEYDFVPDKVHQQYVDYNLGLKAFYQLTNRTSMTASYHYDNYKKYDYYEKLDSRSVNYKNVFVDPKLTFLSEIGKRQEMTGGMEYFSEVLFSDKLFSDSAQEKKNVTYIAFLQDDVKITERMSVIVGGRLDYHTVYGAHFSPKVSGMYQLKRFTFRVNYAKGFRSPSLKELYINWPVAWFTIKGNEHLKPETNNYISGSVEYANRYFDVSITGYYNALKNKIDGIWESGQTVYQYVNVSEARLSGLDFLAKVKISGNILVSGAYSYLHDERPQGELVSSASPHSGNVRFNYHYARKKYEADFNLSAVIVGAKDYVVSEYLMYRGNYVEGFYPVHFDPYSIWRLSVSQSFWGGVKLVLGVNNLFNYKAKVVSFNTSVSPGRRFFISLNVQPDRFIKKK